MSPKYRARVTLILTAMIAALAVVSGCTQKPVKPTVLATCGAGRLERWGMSRVVYLVGDPYQRGLQQGTLLKDQVRTMAALAAKVAAARTGSAARRAALTASLEPDELEEMKGIADGAGVERESILDLNFAYELSFPAACSQFAAIDEAGTFVVGRNLEYYMADIVGKGRVLQIVIPDRGIPYFAPSLAGLAGVLTGINRDGVYVAMNAIPQAEQADDGVPVTVSLRRILLTASSMEQAVEQISSIPAAAGHLLLLVSGSEREFISPEIGCTQSAEVRPNRGDDYIVVTNHYVNSDMAMLVPEMDDNHHELLEQALSEKPVLNATEGIELLTLVGVRPRHLQFATLQSLVWLPDHDEAWLSNSTLPATDGRFICFHPREMLNSFSPDASANFSIDARVMLAHRPPEPGSDLTWRVTVTPKLPLRGLQATLKLSDAVQQLQPGYTMTRTISSPVTHVDPEGQNGSKALRLGITSGFTRIDALSVRDQERLRAALVEPMVLELVWEGGREYLLIPSSDITYSEYERDLPPQ